MISRKKSWEPIFVNSTLCQSKIYLVKFWNQFSPIFFFQKVPWNQRIVAYMYDTSKLSHNSQCTIVWKYILKNHCDHSQKNFRDKYQLFIKFSRKNVDLTKNVDFPLKIVSPFHEIWTSCFSTIFWYILLPLKGLLFWFTTGTLALLSLLVVVV